MAGGESSEEKTQPASDKKLVEARKKGQLAKSQDMVSAVALLACTLGIVHLAVEADKGVRALLNLVADIYVQPFSQAWPRMVEAAQNILMVSALPLLAVTLCSVLLANLITMKGIVFTGEPIAPDFKRINPAEGLKRIFALRNVIEFIKGIVKVVVLSIAFWVVGRVILQALMESSRCGASCLESVFYLLLKPLLATVLITYLFMGGVDVLLQRWLFRREMRMTKTEQKRERRDADGDPLIKRERVRLRREQGLGGRKTGVENAILMIGVEGGWLVGIRYVRGETPVPLVACAEPPERADGLMAMANMLGLPRAADMSLATRIGRAAKAGEPIPANTFQSVADALVAARLI